MHKCTESSIAGARGVVEVVMVGSVCVCLCVRERERERQRDSNRDRQRQRRQWGEGKGREYCLTDLGARKKGSDV